MSPLLKLEYKFLIDRSSMRTLRLRRRMKYIFLSLAHDVIP
jgi:hypothetical protein